MFLNKFKKPIHNYPKNVARPNYSIPPFKLNKSKYRIATDTKKAAQDQYL